MKAAVYESYGSPEVVTIRDVPKPTAGKDEVLIRILATSVTSGDVRMRAFDIPPLFKIPARFMLGYPKPKKQVLGFEYAGIVDAIGPGVTNLKLGDEIFGGHVGGMHAEYAVVAATSALALKPKSISFDEAASIPFGAHTALTFLRKASITPGQRVLIIGASGAVGAYAVQIARHMGAEITAVCSDKNADLVRSLGASQTIDYTKADITKLDQAFDVVIETVGSLTFTEALPLIAPNGAFVAIVMSPADVGPMLWPPARKGRRLIGGEAEDTAENMRAVAALVTSGAIRPVIDSIYPLTQIRDAHARVDTKRKRGAVVVTLS